MKKKKAVSMPYTLLSAPNIHFKYGFYEKVITGPLSTRAVLTQNHFDYVDKFPSQDTYLVSIKY